ncbi:nSTAND1 domain-containing NTPase [Methyloterricola oryzae]|uniref:nSTAND1 domain-containing NTPase n=1 Tax=Methyloterricola oryzae TaxID=1495050 RepID=UPI0005EAF047|nr:SUMF1/EgtB/PvdO family nonheme iron enzyme [Methyloterricola oryzae]
MRALKLNLSPYVGLRPYTEKEALLFFGRDAHVRDLLAKLEGRQRFIPVLGASGTGKSSLVRAGLIPALHRGALAEAGHSWQVCIIKPGDAPLANLARGLAEDSRWLDGEHREMAVSALRASLGVSPLALSELRRAKAETFGEEALLLVVDQFEEIFRYRQQNPDEADRFIQLLLRSAREDVPIYVVITMRSDFLGSCVAFFGLPEAINGGLYLTPRLSPEQLKSVIASPLGLVGGSIDPVLVTRLVNGLKGEDELPVLQHALLRMWNRAQEQGRSRIEAEDFEAVCSAPEDEPGAPDLAYAIDRHAEELYLAFAPEAQMAARRIFPALVERQGNTDVRRPQNLAELAALTGEGQDAMALSVVEAFRSPGAGFLLPAPEQALEAAHVVDFSHEALIRQWRRLQDWLTEDEADAQELREWRQRAMRQQSGGGWLDNNDCERAERWQERLLRCGDAKRWALRYVSSEDWRMISAYIDASRQRLTEEAEERERLQQELRQSELKRLRSEARWAKGIAISAMVLLVGGLLLIQFLAFKDEHLFSYRAAVYALLGKTGIYTLQPEMVQIPPEDVWRDPAKRSFLMGSEKIDLLSFDTEYPQHPVTFAKPFEMGRYEVTFDEYQVFAYLIEGDGGCADRHKIETPGDQDSGWGRGKRPAIGVSWDDAICYAQWLSRRTGKAYRLPSEAEWEYAARAGTTTSYWWGDGTNLSKAVCRDCTAEFEGRKEGKESAEAGDPAIPLNPWGLQNTSGNVQEWVRDCAHESYEGAPVDGSAWEEAGCESGQRVMRGGSWEDVPGNVRSATRSARPPDYRFNWIGFRLAKTL